ncbi:MAG: selenocysteine-specific translation elongation factor [Syntrophothermus sp.]
MKHVVIGTAGHVDHGKTTLIHRLTGVNTDRLKEERERGITIDLGFAPFTLPSGRRAAVIDVPGHERFIKNMLAGVAGIDVVLFVVAADEGVMPQTVEHLEILNLLHVKQGVVALTKTDLVDEEWLELVKEEIRQRLEGTSLAGSPIVSVSAVTGQGIPELLERIEEVVAAAAAKEGSEIARLPVDRVFAITGHGTVVTGTLLGGRIKEGDNLEILPQRREVRVRQIQVHDNPVKSAENGQRVALNLVGVEKQEVARGDVVATPGVLEPTTLADATLHLLASAQAMRNGARVRLHVGASEIMARVRLLDRDMLEPGETAYAQLGAEKPLIGIRGDLFVIRSYSPAHTIGGGRLLEMHPPGRKRFRPETLAELAVEDRGSPAELIVLALKRAGSHLRSVEDLFGQTLLDKQIIQETLEKLIKSGEVVALGNNEWYLSTASYADLRKKAGAVLEEFHKSQPLRPGMPKEELRSRLARSWDPRPFNLFLQRLIGEGLLGQEEELVRLAGFKAGASQAEEKEYAAVEEAIRRGGATPPGPVELSQALHIEPKRLEAILQLLIRRERLIKAAEGVFFHAETVQQARDIVAGLFRETGSLETGAFRDRLETSRKYAIALLEYFDQMRLTRRAGDKRMPGPGWQAGIH